MRTADAIKHFGGTKAAVADALGIRQPSVQNWGEFPPPEQQMRIHKVTTGKLKAERDVLTFYRELTEGVL